jgi:clan AA aspartic protease
MIRGVVEALEPRIKLTIRGPRGRSREVEAVIDTGFSGELTLPGPVIQALRLPWLHDVRGTLADGSVSVLATYDAAAVWDRRERPIVVVESGGACLVGMELLSGFELRMQVRPQGKVTIKRLSS